MLNKTSAKLLAAALIAAPAALIATPAPVVAQGNFSISFGYFHDELAPYGRWYHHPRWGDVWHPIRVERDFRPYRQGYWDYTNRYGWVWVSDNDWGDITSHYGRWVYDPNDGWLWVPGYVWAPAWVIWRSSPGYVGWLPMPPDERFLRGDEIYRTDWNDWDRGYGYEDWYGPNYGSNWLASIAVWVDDRHFADRDFIRYAPPRDRVARIARDARNVTNYVTINNYIVNRSVDVGRIERASGRRITPTPEQTVVRTRTPIEPVNTGRQIQLRERSAHGGDPRASARDKPVVFTPEREQQVRRERQQQAQGGPNPRDQVQREQVQQVQREQAQQRQQAEREQTQQQRQQAQREQGRREQQSQREQAQQRQQAEREQTQQQRQQAQREQAQRDQQGQREQAQQRQQQQAQGEQAQQQRQQQQAQREQAQQQQAQREQAQREQAQQQRQQQQAQREQAQQRQTQQPQRDQGQQRGQQEHAQREQAQQQQQAQRDQAQQDQQAQNKRGRNREKER